MGITIVVVLEVYSIIDMIDITYSALKGDGSCAAIAAKVRHGMGGPANRTTHLAGVSSIASYWKGSKI
jgi:hypothetical protein